MSEPRSFHGYLQQSRERLSFIGEWRERAALAAGEAALAEFIARVNPHCAMAGQVRNDLRNTQPREQELGGLVFSDFEEGKMTAVTFLAIDLLLPGAIDTWLPSKVNPLPLLLGQIKREGKSDYIFQAITELGRFLGDFIELIEHDIKTSELTEDVKTLWKGWVYRQLRTGIINDHDEIHPESSAKFLQAVENLSQRPL